MFWLDLVFALVVGLMMTLILMVVLRKDGPWTSLPLMFLVVLLAAWVGGRWLGPVGPRLLEMYWLPFVLGGIAGGLLLAAAVRLHSGRVEEKEVETGRPAEASIGLFMWLEIVILIFAIIVAYI